MNPKPFKSQHSPLYSSAAYMLLARLSIKSLGLISSVVLARMLTPDDFGLVAIAMALYAFIELFGAFGFGTVLIQRKEKNITEYNTAWTFKFLFGLTSSSIIFLLAQPASVYFSDSRLENILYCIACISIISGASNIGTIDFQKDMEFKKELNFLLLPKIISFIVTITLALHFRNYWALVLGMIFAQLLNLTFSYAMHPFRPKLTFEAMSTLFNFSKWLFFHNIVQFVNTKISEIIIGKKLSLTDAGFFTLANEFASIPTTEIAAPINKASYPLYARQQGCKVRLREAYLKALMLTASLTLPASLGIFVVAPLFIEVVLGEQWVAASTLMQLIALSGIFSSVTNNIGYVYLALGQARANFFIGLGRCMLYLPLLLLLLPKFGLDGAGYAALISSAMLAVATHYASSRVLSITLIDIIKTLFVPILSTIGMYIILDLLPRTSAKSLDLLIALFSGALSYCIFMLFIFCIDSDNRALIKSTVQNILKKLFNK